MPCNIARHFLNHPHTMFKNLLTISLFLLIISSCEQQVKNNQPSKELSIEAKKKARIQEESITKAGVDILFRKDSLQFSTSQKKMIQKIIHDAEKNIRKLLPTLPKNIKVIVYTTPIKLEQVGGVSGRAARNNTALVFLEVSRTHPSGITSVIKNGFAATVYHEFHHLYRGWAIRDNKFRQGIDIATINEGLAVVFSEIYTGAIEEGNAYLKGTHKWVDEILKLPKNADYGKWMFEHPDGRTAIGYRTGNYIITKVMEKSKKSILELSKLSPKEIYKLAGYELLNQ
ncbi:MAG: hypothetical protein JKZ00_05640 [Flavobacteriaceae bacterium]|nr:hypothetical protein [Flavobacteriaceae bacterium]